MLIRTYINRTPTTDCSVFTMSASAKKASTAPKGKFRVENGGRGICGAKTQSGKTCQKACGPRGGKCHLHNHSKPKGVHQVSKGGVGVCGANTKSGNPCQKPQGKNGGKCHLHA